MSGFEEAIKSIARRVKALHALESGSYRSYLLGQSVSAIGTGLQQVALAWFVYRITHSSAALAALTAMLLAGQVLLSFVGGCLADKCDRRKLLIALQWSGAAIAVLLAAIILTKVACLPVILILALILGSFAALEYPARQALNTEFVHKDHLLSARGLYSCVCASSIALGQASAGVVIDLLPQIGEACCALLNAASFIFSLIVLKKITTITQTISDPAHHCVTPCSFPTSAQTALESASKEDSTKPAPVASRTSVMSNKECIEFVLSSETIQMTFIQTMVLVLFGLRFLSLLPAFAAEIFNGGAKESGILTATVAIGFSVGGLICGGIRQKERLELWSDLSLILLPLGLLAFCLSGQIHIALLSVLIIAVCQSTNINACICLMQLSAPDRLFGRLMGLRVTVVAFCDLIGALVIALVVQNMGLQATVMTAAFLCFLAAVLIFSRRALSSTAGRVPVSTEEVPLRGQRATS